MNTDKPEKNCGNCKWRKADNDCIRPMVAACLHYDWWQPKSAEPQSWEQEIRLMADMSERNEVATEKLICNIRAEIEAAREEEKQAVVKYLVKTDNEDCFNMDCDNIGCIECAARKIEQNKHREIK